MSSIPRFAISGLVLALSACQGPGSSSVGPSSGGGAPSGGFASGGGESNVTSGGGTSPHAGGGASSSGGEGGGAVTTGGVSGAGGAVGGAGVGGGSSTGGVDSESGGSGTGGTSIEALTADFDAYWDFETAAGSTVPPLVGEAALTLTGASLGVSPFGQGVLLAGQDSTVSASEPIIDTAGDFSIAAWVRLDKLDSFNTFVSVSGAQVSAVFLQKRSDGRFALTTMPSDSTSASSCATSAELQPRTGEWYFVVGTRSGTTREQRVYVDGVLSGKSTCPGGVFTAQGPALIGQGFYGGQAADFTTGAIDEVGLISRLLTPIEVLDLYQAGRPTSQHYLFAYFVEVSQGRGDGLRLAHSHDGLHWGAIGAGKAFLKPTVGGKSFRDPHVMLGPDGRYHVVWTTSCVPWAESNCVQDRGFGHASAPDLVHFDAAEYVPIDLNVEHVWAPETYFDAESQKYMVFWSSPLDQNPSASDPHSIYYTLTSDFQSFSPPQVLYQKSGRNFIDATILADSSGFLMVLKDEADGQKNLRALRSPVPFGEGAWTAQPSAPLTGNYAAEGPSFLEREGELFVYFDKYGEGAYGALQAQGDGPLDEPQTWQDVSSTVFFPGVRHGTPILVPSDVFRAVALAAAE